MKICVGSDTIDMIRSDLNSGEEMIYKNHAYVKTFFSLIHQYVFCDYRLRLPLAA